MNNCNQPNNDIEIIRGDNEAIEVQFIDTETSKPIDITGYTVYFTVNTTKRDTNDDDAIIRKDVTNHTDPVNGKTVILLSTTDTNLDPRNYYYDVQFKDDDGKIKTVIVGDLSVILDVTKRD